MAEGNTYPIVFAMQVEGDSEVQSKMKGTAEKVEDLGQSTENTASRTGRLTGALKDSALGLSAAASGAVGLYFQFDNLEKSSLRVETAQKNLTVAQATLASAQASLNRLNEKGISDGPDYEAAVLRLKGAQEQLGIAEQKVGLAQGDLTEAQLGFALNVIPTSINAITSITDVTSKFKFAKLANAAASAEETLAENSSRFARITAIPATFAATAATQGYTAAIKGAMIAMGPVGWTIIGISTAMGLFATNAFGMRDAINAAGKAIGDAFPLMKPLLDGLGTLAKTIFPEASAAAESSSSEATKHLETLSSSGSTSISALQSAVATGADGISLSLNGISKDAQKAADDVAKSVDKMKSKMDKLGIRTPKEGASDESAYKTLSQQTLSEERRAGIENQLTDLAKTIQYYKDYGIGNLNREQQNALAGIIEKQAYGRELIEKDNQIRNYQLPSGQTVRETQNMKLEIQLTADAELKAKILSGGRDVDLVYHSN